MTRELLDQLDIEARGKFKGETLYSTLVRGILNKVEGGLRYRFLVDNQIPRFDDIHPDDNREIAQAARELLYGETIRIGRGSFQLLNDTAVELLGNLSKEQLNKVENIGLVKGEIVYRALQEIASRRRPKLSAPDDNI